MKNYYDILGLDIDASKEDIKKAYKTLAFRYHPDKTEDTVTSDFFKEINEAQQILLNDWKRNEYDLLLIEQTSATKFSRMMDGIAASVSSIRLSILNLIKNKMKLAIAILLTVLAGISVVLFSSKKQETLQSTSNASAESSGLKILQQPKTSHVTTGTKADIAKVDNKLSISQSSAYPGDNLTSEKKIATNDDGFTAYQKPLPLIPAKENKAVPKANDKKATVSRNKQVEASSLVKLNFSQRTGALPFETAPPKELTNPELIGIVEKVNALAFNPGGSKLKCVQVRKSKNSNVDNAFKVAELLQQKGFVIGGRETLNSNSDGINIVSNGTCLYITIGKMR